MKNEATVTKIQKIVTRMAKLPKEPAAELVASNQVRLYMHDGPNGPYLTITCNPNEVIECSDVAAQWGSQWHDNIDAVVCGSDVGCIIFEHGSYYGHRAVFLPGQFCNNTNRDGLGNDCDSYYVYGKNRISDAASRASRDGV